MYLYLISGITCSQQQRLWAASTFGSVEYIAGQYSQSIMDNHKKLLATYTLCFRMDFVFYECSKAVCRFLGI